MFRERIQAQYNELTPSFRKLADFILENQLDAAFMTATELAQMLDVDAATVVRFAQTLGYSGFRELVKEIQEVVKAELTASYTTSLEGGTDADLFRNLLENERHNLKLAQAQMTEHVNALLPALRDAMRVWVTGQGISRHLAAACVLALREVGVPAAFFAADPLEAATNLKDLSPADVVLGFAVTGMALDVAGAVEFAREQGAKTFVFSASGVTPAALAAETPIVCPGPTQTHTPSFTGLAAMIVALAAAFAARYPDAVAEQRMKLQDGYRHLLESQARTSAELDVDELWREF
jgi:DNA-binding MurR/RpiR family transcriptional regulator